VVRGGKSGIQVKGRRAGKDRQCTIADFDPAGDWDWLAIVRVNVDDGARDMFLIPRDAAVEMGRPRPQGKLGIRFSDPRLQRFADNFSLNPVRA